MRALAQLSGALLAALAIAGCGGSKPASDTTSPASTTSAPAASSTSTTLTQGTSTATTPAKPKSKSKSKPNPKPKTGTNTATSSSGGVSAQPSPSPTGGSSPGTSVKSPAGGSSNARVPATFTIRASGVSPATVSAPAFLAVQLTAISGDAREHAVMIVIPEGSRSLRVPAGGRASVLIPGLKAGEYVVKIDGKPRALLLIGGEPGP